MGRSMDAGLVRKEPPKDKFGRCKSCRLKDYHAEGCKYWVLNCPYVTLSDAEAEVVYAALQAAGNTELAAQLRKRRTYDDLDHKFIKAAREQYQKDGEIEVDERCMTSRGDDEEGCYVMAWVYVYRNSLDEDSQQTTS